MSNLKDLEILEPLSLEEMEQVVGGRGWSKPWKRKRRRSMCPGATTGNDTGQTVIDNNGIDLGLDDDIIVVGG